MKLGSIGTCCGCVAANYLRVCYEHNPCKCIIDSPTYSITIDAEGETITDTLPNLDGRVCLTFPRHAVPRPAPDVHV
jgi:hypothetical protein